MLYSDIVFFDEFYVKNEILKSFTLINLINNYKISDRTKNIINVMLKNYIIYPQNKN